MVIRLTAVSVLVPALLDPTTLSAWTSEVHSLMTSRALAALERQQPPLTPESKALLVRASQQPDLMRPRELPELRDSEAARHYIDLELLEGRELPPTAPAYYRLLVDLSETPGSGIPRDWDLQSVGTLPYALVESTERLIAVFAQLRRRPDDAALQMMAAYLAGAMAHYAQDLCQPLHTTIHHDGRARIGGRSPETGIHRRVDGLPGRMTTQLADLVLRQPRVLGPLFPEAIAALKQSHDLVDEVYRQERVIDRVAAGGDATSALRGFVADRYAQSVELTADLLLTAWQRSGSIQVPGWALTPASQPR